LSYQKGVNKFRGLLLIKSFNKTNWGCLFPSLDYASGGLSLFLRLISLFERYKITCGIFSCSFSKTAALVNSVLYTIRFILKKEKQLKVLQDWDLITQKPYIIQILVADTNNFTCIFTCSISFNEHKPFSTTSKNDLLHHVL